MNSRQIGSNETALKNFATALSAFNGFGPARALKAAQGFVQDVEEKGYGAARDALAAFVLKIENPASKRKGQHRLSAESVNLMLGSDLKYLCPDQEQAWQLTDPFHTDMRRSALTSARRFLPQYQAEREDLIELEKTLARAAEIAKGSEGAANLLGWGLRRLLKDARRHLENAEQNVARSSETIERLEKEFGPA